MSLKLNAQRAFHINTCQRFSAKKNNLVARALAFGLFSMLSALAGVAQKRCDVILVMSPPLTLGLAGWLTALRHRAPLVLNIQDIHPEAAVATGSVTNPQIISILEALESLSYKKADAITALSDDLRLNIATRIEYPEKVRVIPNFVDTDWIYPDSKFNNYRMALGLTDEVVIMYAGNLGYSQPIEIVIDTARTLQDRQEIVFVINGEGSRREELEAKATGLKNMRFVDFSSHEDLNEVLAAADIHLILLKPGLGTASVPSKLYSILAAGRPVLASVDTGTEIDYVNIGQHRLKLGLLCWGEPNATALLRKATLIIKHIFHTLMTLLLQNLSQFLQLHPPWIWFTWCLPAMADSEKLFFVLASTSIFKLHSMLDDPIGARSTQFLKCHKSWELLLRGHAELLSINPIELALH